MRRAAAVMMWMLTMMLSWETWLNLVTPGWGPRGRKIVILALASKRSGLGLALEDYWP